eukprot:1196436-Pleurochrysis_carterae.AAC.1
MVSSRSQSGHDSLVCAFPRLEGSRLLHFTAMMQASKGTAATHTKGRGSVKGSATCAPAALAPI